jgi:septal ring factor EnvC (AmiA/AmiB activator)
MEKTAQLIFDDDEESEVTLIKDLDLDLGSLFKLTYNFDILKNAIFTIFKNQESLLKKISKNNLLNNEQKNFIDSFEKNIKEKYITKEEYNETKNNLESKIQELTKKIAQIDEEFTKSNYII